MQPATTISIGIADDHALFLSSLKTIVLAESEFLVRVEASNGKSYIEKCWQLGFPDISILDVNMPVLNGLETLRCVKNMNRESRVVLMTGYSDWVTQQELQLSGAHSLISKNAEATEFLATIRLVRDMPISTAKNSGRNNTAKLAKAKELNQKELQFAKLLSTGISYSEIAEQMHLSKHTIYDYRDRMFGLFEVNSQASLIVKLIGNLLERNTPTTHPSLSNYRR